MPNGPGKNDLVSSNENLALLPIATPIKNCPFVFNFPPYLCTHVGVNGLRSFHTHSIDWTTYLPQF